MRRRPIDRPREVMKGIVQDRYGSPEEVLRLRDVEPPAPGDSELLVRVRASCVHPDVWHVVTGRPWILRLMGSGFLRPKNPVPGTDVAGIVEEVGRNVTRFAPGDAVFGETTGGCSGSTGERSPAGPHPFSATLLVVSVEVPAAVLFGHCWWGRRGRGTRRRLALAVVLSMRMSIPGALALTAIALAACSGGNPAGPESLPTEAPSDAESPTSGSAATVELRYDQLVVHDGLELRLVAIGDSRCPTGVVCVWEGEVAARLEVTRGSEDPVEIQLTLPAGSEPEEALAHGRLLRLLAVDPYPEYGVTTPREAYVARVEIRAA